MKDNRRPLLFLSLLISVCATPTFAIVNIETMRAKITSGFGGEAEFSASYSSGNTEALDVGYGLGIRFSTPSQAFFFLTRGELREQADSRYAQKAFAHARYHWRPQSRLSLESFVQLQYDEALRLSSRFLAGGGLRINLASSERSAVFAGLALMYEREEFQESGGVQPPTNEVARFSSYLSLTLSSPRLKFSSITYYQPRVDEFADSRALNQSSINAPLSENLALTVNFNLGYDGHPAPGVDKLDTRMNLGLKFTF